MVSYQWMSLGIQLEFDPNLLQVIRSSVHHDPTAALQELMTRWVQRTNPPPMLKSLADAMSSGVIGNPVFANMLLDQKEDFPSIKEDITGKVQGLVPCFLPRSSRGCLKFTDFCIFSFSAPPRSLRRSEDEFQHTGSTPGSWQHGSGTAGCAGEGAR